MNKDEFDRMFDDAFDEASNNYVTVPDSTASWKRVEDVVRRRQKRLQRLKVLPYVAASFLLGAFIFGTPTVTKAFTPFFHTIKSIQIDVVSLIFGSKDKADTEPKTSAPGDSGSTSEGSDMYNGEMIERQYNTWEEASKQVAFAPISINYVPKELKQTDITLYFRQTQERAGKAVLLYDNNASQRLMITIRVLDKNETLTSNNTKKSGTVETIKINSNEAYLFIANDNRVSLEYMTVNMYVSISGSLSKEEMIKVAKNIN
ncbi:hypothetical protein Back11_37990 [Paenibacillus baekrokdamisoli]|uniref:Uncharacterized protein n=1 Tax=Paenibacillus baekrokdamisoli TaxID=1712516 RepID=A0A3G9JH81_9BACL|nr:DUF4367 domain-containing protein [Paenibacillus baekrokdamisoli]MBB3068505.1 hypothetical protein [Paenibacillus baekrokdamisoli]BBH22454.1 hypothetical protein Back11_37990 [Paenibacillus baekrokdamisoli]